MFTGLIANLGEVEAVEATGDGARLRVRTPLASELAAGDSVAVNGVCLTATTVEGEGFVADVVSETLRRSSLSRPGRRSTSSCRCEPRIGWGATWYRVTSTALGRSSTWSTRASRAS